MKTGILFDLDGTLLDTLQDLADAVNHILRQYGCMERTTEEICGFVGHGVKSLIRQAMAEEDGEKLDRALADYQVYYAAHSQVKTCPYAGIPEALKEIGEKYPIAIVSNKPDVFVKPMCSDYFPGIYALGEAPERPKKPEPDMLFKAMQDIGVDRCIYVGDSEVDVTTAKNAGAKCLSVLWGFRDRACLEKAGGRYFCENPADLLKKLEEMM